MRQLINPAFAAVIFLISLVIGCDVQDSQPAQKDADSHIASTDTDTVKPDPDTVKPDTEQHDEDTEEPDEDAYIPPVTNCGTPRGNTERAELIPQDSQDVLGDSPDPRYVRLSWQSEPWASMTVTWTTKDSSASKMTRSSILTVCENEEMTEGCVTIDKNNQGKGIGAVWNLPYSNDWKTVHTAEICRLEPDTTYYYKVGGTDGTEEVFSTVAPFRTSLAPGNPAKLVFVAMGDSRGAPDKLARTLEQSVNYAHPSFILFGGDMVEDGTKQSQWFEAFDAMEKTGALRSTPLLPIIGNHEKSSINYYAQFALPGNEYWYSLEAGNAAIVGLTDCFSGAGIASAYAIACTGAMIKPDSVKAEQAAFIRQVFNTSDAPFKFVTHHRPIYSETSDLTHGGWANADLKDAWAPVFDEQHVTMVFNGHDHFYQRSVPIKGGQKENSPTAGVNYIVTAGAGASLYDVKSTDMVVSTKSAIHFTVVTIEGKEFLFKSLEMNKDSGEITGELDTFSFSK